VSEPTPIQVTATPDTSSSVAPLLNCVTKKGSNTFTAFFGYHNNGLAAAYTPIGDKNKFTSGEIDRGQPTEFGVGTYNNVFSITWEGKSDQQWQLNGSILTASHRSAQKNCESIPVQYGISDSVTGNVVVTDDSIFWLDAAEGGLYLYQYNVLQKQKVVLRDFTGMHVYGLASDGKTVVWIESGFYSDNSKEIQSQISALVIESKKEFTLVESVSSTGFLPTLAIDEDILYYVEVIDQKAGLYLYDISNANKDLIDSDGYNPIAKKGLVLWQRSVAGTETIPVLTSALILSKNRGLSEEIIVEQTGYFVNVGTDGDTITWSSNDQSPANRFVTSLRYSKGSRETFNTNGVGMPVTRDGVIVWSDASIARDGKPRWDVYLNENETSSKRRVIDAAVNNIHVAGITRKPTQLAITINEGTGFYRLFVVPADAKLDKYLGSNANNTAMGAQEVDAPYLIGNSESIQAVVESAGAQVGISGSRFTLNSVPWTMKGVHFLLPEYNINGFTFYDARYQQSAQSRSYWLSKAESELYPSVLRIFVDPPGESENAGGNLVSVSTVYNFAQEARARGFRLGVVLHNSGNFNLNSASRAVTRQWISNLITCFRGQGLGLGCGSEILPGL